MLYLTNNGNKKAKLEIPLFAAIFASFSSRGIEDQMSKQEGEEKNLAQSNALNLFCSSHPGGRGIVEMLFTTK